MNKYIWHIVNALLAGLLVFIGACTAGGVTEKSLIAAGLAALAVAFTKINEFWNEEEPKRMPIFNFIG